MARLPLALPLLRDLVKPRVLVWQRAAEGAAQTERVALALVVLVLLLRRGRPVILLLPLLGRLARPSRADTPPPERARRRCVCLLLELPLLELPLPPLLLLVLVVILSLTRSPKVYKWSRAQEMS